MTATSMANLAYYRTEHETFKTEYATQLSDVDTDLFFGKLKTHYDFRQELVRKGRRGHGSCNQWTLRVASQTSLGILTHEVAHALQFKRRAYAATSGMKFHTKHHTTIMKRVLAYVHAHKEAWLAVQKAKQERYMNSVQNQERHAQEQERFRKTDEFKMGRLRQREARLLTKAKRIATLLKKVQRQIKYYARKPKVLNR